MHRIDVATLRNTLQCPSSVNSPLPASSALVLELVGMPSDYMSLAHYFAKPVIVSERDKPQAAEEAGDSKVSRNYVLNCGDNVASTKR